MPTEDLPSLTDTNLERVLRLSAGPHLDAPVWWRRGYHGNDGGLRLLVNDSDFFHWGCAGAEPIGDADVDLLATSLADAAAAAPEADIHDRFLLYCARRVQMRPQGAFYPALHPDLWLLFDACGPERAVDFGNPKPRPTERPEPRAPRRVDPDIPVLPVPGNPLAAATLPITDVRRVLLAFCFDYTDHVRWIVDAEERLRFYVTVFGAFTDNQVGCEAAEVTPSNVEPLIAAMEAATSRGAPIGADERVAVEFVARERGLAPSSEWQEHQEQHEERLARIAAKRAEKKPA